MKMLACKMMEAGDCNFEVKADTEEEVLDAMMDHGRKYHSDKMKTMSMDDAKNMMKEKMVTV